MAVAMLHAFALAAAQLGDRRILAVLARTVALTVAIFVALGWGLWWLIDRWAPAAIGGHGWIVAVVAAALLAWLLFRLVALAVLQLFGDEIVAAVEQRHYPAAAALARPLGLRAELRAGLAALRRSLGYNLVALPPAALLIVTGVGAALLFAVVNAALLGRELTEMVALRHRGAAGEAPLPPFGTRLLLGAAVVLLLMVPFLNLLAPVLGAAAATHLVHARLAEARAARA